MNADLKSRLKVLDSPVLDKAGIDALFQDYPFEDLLALLATLESKKEKDSSKILRTFLSSLSRDPVFSPLFLFSPSPSHRSNMLGLLKSEHSLTRELLSNSLLVNAEEIGNRLNAVAESNRELFVDYLTVIFYQLNDPEAEIGLKIQKLLIKMGEEAAAQKKDKWFLLEKESLEFLMKGVSEKEKKDVVKMRIMEIIVVLASKSIDFLKAFQEILEKSFEIYDTDDLLLKLNVVEVISKLGDSNWTSDFLGGHSLFRKIMKDAFKYLLLLLSKMLSNETIKFEATLRKNITLFLLSALSSSSLEEIEGGLEVLGPLLRIPQGLELVIKDKALITEYVKFSKAVQDNLRKKFINSFSNAFSPKNNSKRVEQFFCLLGNPKMAQNLDIALELDEASRNSMAYVFNMLYSPFSEFENEALNLLNGVLNFEFGVRELAKNKQSIDYLTQHFAKTKEIFDLKSNINGLLREKLGQSQAIKDPIVKEFAKKYFEALEMHKGGGSVVYYKTEAKD